MGVKMEIKEVEKMWNWDVIKSIIIGHDHDTNSFTIEFFNEEERCLGTLEAARGGRREFKTLDAAAKTLKAVGINQFQVVL